jgi:N-acetylmuramoyl-L-alanine amidase
VIKLKNLSSVKGIRWIVLILLVVLMASLVYERQAQKEAEAMARKYAIASRQGDFMLLARVVSGEARGESYLGQVGVASVVVNRTKHPKFPNTIAGVIYQPGAFESVSNGQIWAAHPTRSNINAARDALNGFDPTYGCLFFWNPYKRVSRWIWSRSIVTQIGKHVFGR